MKKELILTAVLLTAFLATFLGCGTTTGSEQNFRTGSQGLVMNFVANAPPARLYNSDTMNVEVELWNKGAERISGGNLKLYISGFEPKIFSGLGSSSKGLSGDLLGKKDMPEGDYQSITFDSGIDLGDADSYSPTLQITACYSYKTVATAQLCIDPNPTARRLRVCTPATVSLGTQGAPIAVTRIEEEPTRGNTRLRFYVSNVGGGSVFKDGKTDQCSPYSSTPLARNDYDVIHISKVAIHGEGLSNCNPKDEIRLYNNQASFFCEYKTNGNSPAYTTPVNIELTYGYMTQISKAVEIKKINT